MCFYLRIRRSVLSEFLLSSDLPKDRKAIGSKWVFRKKLKSDGSLDKYKAWLVANGFTQVEGIDYEETFSLVVEFQSIRTLAALVARRDLELHQMDVKTAFLNGELEKEIYMKQPKGSVVQGNEDKVYKVNRALYELKQASRQWYKKFHQAIGEIGFVPNKADTCFYMV